MRYFLLALLICLSAPVAAQRTLEKTPDLAVHGFYEDYSQALQREPSRWLQALVTAQRAHLETELADLLMRLADGVPGGDEPWLDFDPFSNSQIEIEDYMIGRASHHQGLAYVPVLIKFDFDTEYHMRVRAVLRQHGSDWKIANFVYPAEEGMEAWDLLRYLRDSFRR